MCGSPMRQAFHTFPPPCLNRLLSTAEKYFLILRDGSLDEMRKTFAPLLHTVLLIWQNAESFRKPKR